MAFRFQHIFLGLLVVASAANVFGNTSASSGTIGSLNKPNDEASSKSKGPIIPTIGNPRPKEKKVEQSKIDTEVFELGVYGGMLTVEDFGTTGTYGIKMNFHATEDFFIQANYAQAEVGRSSFEELSGPTVSFLTDEEREITLYNFLVGYNLFPGEAFMTPELAFNTAFYLVSGVGNTQFAGDQNFTFTLGTGYRVILTDWLTWNIDYRAHIFETEILALKKTTNNLELSTGITVFF